MKFRTIVSKDFRQRHYSPTGDRITEVKGWIYEDGEYKYVVKKRHNHFEETQAARDSVDIHKIVERYLRGEEDVLDRVNGFYLDEVSLPKTYGELYDAMSQAQDIFNNMPLQLKEKFDHNPAKFWKEYGTLGFDTLLNDIRATYISPDADDGLVNTSGQFGKEVTNNEPESE